MDYNIIDNFEKIEFGANVLIYGTGEAAKVLFGDIIRSRKDVTIRGFVDSYKVSGEYLSLPVINVSELESFRKCKIIIASIYYKEIGALLKKKRWDDFYVYNNISRLVELYDSFLAIDKKRLHILAKEPHSFDKRTYFIINTDINQKKIVISGFLSLNQFPKKSYSYTNATDNLYRMAFKRYKENIFSDICIIDAGGDDFHLAGLIKFITVSCSKDVKLFKIPSNEKVSYVVESKKVLFIPIWKNATSSTAVMLERMKCNGSREGNKYDKPRKIVDVTSSFFCDYNKFSIVRNPYNRLYSFYANLQRLGKSEYLNASFSKIIKPYTFSNFCKFVAKCPDQFSNIHFESQTSILTTHEGLMKDVKILRFENYAEEIENFLGKFDDKINLVHENRSRPSKCNYIRDYYTPELIKLVNERYEDDFINFGYDFL